MDSISNYREIIKQLLTDYVKYPPAYGDVEMETIFDQEQDRYQLMVVGWRGKKRIHGCLVHIDIKDDKVWLQHDSTDAEIAQSLVEMGILAEDIVLAFYPEHRRQYTGFAIN
jgi:hypothetical protein